MVVLAIVATTGGTYFGMREGRAEMKRWQDNYYAKQRVVEGFVTIPISDWQYLVRESFHPVVMPVPPKKAKPAKCSHSLNGGTATVYWPSRKDGICYSADMPGFGQATRSDN